VSLPGPLSIGDRDPFYEFTPEKSGDTWRLTEKEGFAGIYDMTYFTNNSTGYSVALETEDDAPHARMDYNGNGSSGIQRLTAEAPKLGLPGGSDGFTIEVKARPATGASSSIQITWQDDPNVDSVLLSLGFNKIIGDSDTLSLLGRTTANSLTAELSRSPNITLGQWHHVRFVLNLTEGTTGVALNGSKLGGSGSLPTGVSASTLLSRYNGVRQFAVTQSDAVAANTSSRVDVRDVRLYHKVLPIDGFTPD